MKKLIPAGFLAVIALLVVAQKPATEEAAPEALANITAALPEKPYAMPKKNRQLLVFSKTNGYRHASIATGKIALTIMGQKTGAFTAIISDDLANFEADQLKQFDAVCFLNTTLNVFAPHPDIFKTMSPEAQNAATVIENRLKDNLMAFIKSGKGFIGIHAATDCFYEWAEYGKMINGCFDGHPWGAKTQVSVKVEPGQESHPLAAMFDGKNMEFPEEIYQFKAPYDSNSVNMLLRIDTAKTDMTVKDLKRSDNDYGIAWARHWSAGRVFYCSLGHNPEIYWNPKILRHYLAGIQWALGDYEVDVKSAE